ncbi:hypothetical protein GCM10010218_05420 [Streptomyces mashuensis]|uniref:DUF3631 domain-containing protein n=1 Tax=Streptomyces mashuensis TaxID=33904 RepID=A0A919EA13_9ACTN|nr:DUF3631 domain-containing protein [Streptomyces mashuensis]GHF27386.1 hypothetical protein GCM10010218_05420 [Streptomyces mashuensis]
MTLLVDLLLDAPNPEQHCPRSGVASTRGRDIFEAIERVRRADENLAQAVARALSTDGTAVSENPVLDEAIEWPMQVLVGVDLLVDPIAFDDQKSAGRAVHPSPTLCACEAPGTGPLREILRACRGAFSAHGDPTALSTTALLDSCHPGMLAQRADTTTPEFTARDLAEQLKPLGIRPGNVTVSRGVRRKGYRYADFVDAWLRHTPDLSVDRHVSGCRP